MKTVDGKFRPDNQTSRAWRIFYFIIERILRRPYESMSGNGLCPVYLEAWISREREGAPQYYCRTFRHSAPWLRSFPASHLHRVRSSECGNCWTLVIVLPKSKPWGFVQDGVWIPFKQYVFGGKSRKSC
jgi:hypothetical protein